MRRITILLGVLAALMLIPVAQAAASGIMKVNVVGPGGGKVISGGTFSGQGSPAINCTYASPGPASGVCENELETNFEGEEWDDLTSTAAAGSDVGSVTVQKGKELNEAYFGPGYGCSEAAGQAELEGAFGGWVCGVGGEPAGGGAEATVCFVLEGEGEAGCEEETGIPLKVTHEGTGSGTIQSAPAGITCTSGECEHSYAEGTEVTLTASPEPGSAFVAWKNCDTGGVHGRQCTVHVTAGHKTVGAKFEPANTVTVIKAGNGQGAVSGVTCTNTCTEASGIFLASKAVTLKAKANTKTSEFIGWSASPVSCTTPEPTTCSFSSLSANETVEAEFAEMARENLKVTKTGNGQGAVKSSPAGINCSYTCPTSTAYFYKGASVTLTASIQEGKGSTLGNWGGACSGSAATPCVVTMSSAKEVTVGFN